MTCRTQLKSNHSQMLNLNASLKTRIATTRSTRPKPPEGGSTHNHQRALPNPFAVSLHSGEFDATVLASAILRGIVRRRIRLTIAFRC